MVDCASYTQMVPGGYNQLTPEPHFSQCLEGVPETELHLCPPTVLGYSFRSKRWGRFQTEKFSHIVWNPRAFEHLVLSKEKKSLIRSLVCANRTGVISDIITGKAGGSIIILHGQPGTGKTLTAEAAAEIATKPLMVISAAELGEHPQMLESNLQNILDVCNLWEAILLIDEAEVYLEARAFGSSYRNGVVTVLLRLLENHQELIFLTTNHITRIDIAFQSRISVAIKYPPLSTNGQEEIWTTFLKMAGISIIEDGSQRSALTKVEVRKLAGRGMNGR